MEEKYYGNYRAVVENNLDEDGMGRIQVRIFGLHTDDLDALPVENLPWAEPAAPIYGGISGVGVFGVPCQGAHVFLFFEAGNISQPRYFATAPMLRGGKPDETKGFRDPDGIYPLEDEEISLDWNLGSEEDEEEMGSFIIETTHGHVFEMNSKNILIKHANSEDESGEEIEGAFIMLSDDGKIYMNCEISQRSKGNNRIIEGNDDKNVTEDVTSTVGGDKADTVTGSVAQSAGGKITQVCGESYTMSCKSGIISSVGAMMVSSGADSCNTSSMENKIASKMSDVSISAELGALTSKSMRTNIESTTIATISAKSMMDISSTGISKLSSNGLTQVSGSLIIIG